MAELIRAFLALALPGRAIETAALIQEELISRCGDRDVNWVNPENFHITLRFFGDLNPSQITSARELVRQLTGKGADSSKGVLNPAEDTGWSRLGVFPSQSRPTVIWLGLEDGSLAMTGLAAQVNRQLESAGFGKADTPFRAHVTLGRVRRGRTISWREVSNRLTIPQEAFSISQIVLIKSLLTPQGPVYTPIETAQLSV